MCVLTSSGAGLREVEPVKRMKIGYPKGGKIKKKFPFHAG